VAGLLIVLFSVLAVKSFHVVSTHREFYLSEEEIESLKLEVEGNKSPEAAEKLALYFRFVKEDLDAAITWYKKAVDLGDVEAARSVQELETIKEMAPE
jgi:hypothetical protein